MGLFAQAIQKGTPIFDAIALDAKEIDVRRGAEKTILQILPKTIVDGEGDDQRCNSSSHSENGNHRDEAHDGLASFSAQVTGGDEKFETHLEWLSALSLVQLNWIIRSCAGKDRWNVGFVAAEVVAEAFFQFGVFEADHDYACNDR